MKFVASISCALMTIGMIYLDNPEPLNRFMNQRVEQLDHLLYDKEIRFEGLSLVREEELRKLLPESSSVTWWLFNPREIETALLRHSLVQRATVRTCETFAVADWGCFSVAVEERHPAFAALIEDEVWILGQDGGLLFPVPRRLFENEPLVKVLSRYLARDVSATTHLKMLHVAGKSPDLIHARLSYTRKAVEIIERHSGLEVAMARCNRQGEIRVRFDNYPFEVLFDYAEDAPKTLTLEAERLAALVREFGQRSQTIELIDLAYNKLAVVRFQEGQVPGATPTAKAKTMFTTRAPRSSLDTARARPKIPGAR